MPRYAAIDIGSNSIRMQTAEMVPGAPPRILAADREVARLGESVFKNGTVAEQSIQFACDVLSRMSRKYQSLDVAGVRAVATASIRDARNQAEFLERASAAAGTSVEVISGREEARLIHLGVLSRWPEAGPDLFMIDIGGGSAEIMASHKGQLRQATSKPLGAIRLRELFLANDPPAPTELEQLHAFIDEKLEPERERFHGAQYTKAIATSATAAAIVSAAKGIARPDRDDADRQRASTAQVRKIFKAISAMDLDQRRKMPGIGPRRAQIIIPGAAVLLRALELFNLPAVYYSVAGVRDGIIADLDARGIGRELSRLKPDERRDVERMSVRYGVAKAHARQVATFATDLFDCLNPVHALPPGYGRALEASAYLHDVGHFVADSAHHKHSHYIVANSDMPGFTARERQLIANLCRYHRKALPSADHPNLAGLPPDDRKSLLRLIPLLRLADALDRSHAQHVESVACSVKDSQVLLDVQSGVDVGLEKWAAERVGPLFHEVYGYALRVRAPR